ncbi:putative beta-glucosidase [Protomyces lactucae-debilis]|uniref:beta-glucosidase n=1 Tax=Protomyces lactucae-debilis TaxID=2754530 RepID=A0A1Y2F4J9_PROLT|nr:putative beta-glucosidase [Protomyces lactucae-debilis]ORY78256.1 putative beta-glucosidase [Protomyces lactucae-debilis]
MSDNFLWGYATASFQVEGAVDADGRGPSIWDTFTHIPGNIADGSNADVSVDQYHRAEEDIMLLKTLGARAYRFSISWSRVIPLGGKDDPVNEAGVEYYAKLIELCHAHGIVPFVTLHHWDTPQALVDRYGGMLNTQKFVPDFERYATVCFDRFGRDVRHWLTFNEPWVISILGYGIGAFAPGRSSNRSHRAVGDSSTEPWIVGHSCILAHASAVRVYRTCFQAHQRGQIGITLNGDWAEPLEPDNAEHVAAAQRHLEFWIGWFADPIYLGDYPASMRAKLGDRLPCFTDEEKDLVKGSSDFYGMNHYTSNYIVPDECSGVTEYMGDAKYVYEKDGIPIGPQAESTWLRVVPWGFRKLLNWIHLRYAMPIYVTEFGCSVPGECQMSLDQIVQDDFRINYYHGYLDSMLEAKEVDGVDVRAAFPWSLLDNFEWASGLSVRFGVVHVDYDTLVRTPKASSAFVKKWFEDHHERLQR